MSMRKWPMWAATIVMVLGFVAACQTDGPGATPAPASSDGGDGDGGTASSSGGPAPGSSISEATLVAYAQVVCRKRQECAPALLVFAHGTMAQCERRMFQQAKVEFSLPGVSATSAALEGCTAALAAQSCGGQQASVVLPACDLRGVRAAGAACAVNAQCGTGFCARRTATGGTTACGVCRERSRAGAACSPAECEAGLECGRNGQCGLLAPEGAPCDEGRPCTATLSCVSGRCATALPTGAPCVIGGAAECDLRRGDHCNGKRGECEKIAVAAPGAACGADAATGSLAVCAAATCNNASTIGRQCEPYWGDGEPCVEPVGASARACSPPAQCFFGTCSLSASCD